MSTTHFCTELTALLPRLRRFARGLTQDIADADDLCQQTVERALKSRHQWQDGTRLDAWVYRIMRNQWIDEVRARTRRSQTFVHEDEGLNVGTVGAPAAESLVELGNVERALARLPEEQREAVVLVMVEGFAYKEAAEILDIPQGTLTSRLGRGREALLKELGEIA
ncbi:sigma-70 family RNA polymerase sigma factor [Novosphingobium profundi]|uniref:sigma-70 family RNA polymerase sigma factor n=1 Tax=Novosphingobium profundi TaxID=1774954 RepID=UPI001BDA87A9|nr:sigma-70 family RNA polymerase sigma factor [Novosphingobium profundi]MBT0669499.1 sigma-70 family RNA polymerase sigma factor [Novosphingobium profundi]